MNMKIRYSSIIPFSGFLAINLFGTVFVREEARDRIERNPDRYEPIWNHEAIHTEQMKETLYIGFYILYFIFWIIRLLTPPWKTAYRDISFEQEAYLNQANLHYLETRRPYAWISYQFTSYSQARDLKKSR